MVGVEVGAAKVLLESHKNLSTLRYMACYLKKWRNLCQTCVVKIGACHITGHYALSISHGHAMNRFADAHVRTCRSYEKPC